MQQRSSRTEMAATLDEGGVELFLLESDESGLQQP
jgi:hypothetical protein